MHRLFPKPRRAHRKQRGQALIYGLFMLVCGMVALFFVFNTGQLSLEKTKLVNTADAVAYSAGVLHARALNFDAYTNRALMANDVMIAQTVSLSSWVQYAKGHVDGVPPLYCYSYYSVPVGLALVAYAPLCTMLSYPSGPAIVQNVDAVVQKVAEVTVRATDVDRVLLQRAQDLVRATLPVVRYELMRKVAEANYKDDGVVKVDLLPLTDQWSAFDNGPFISRYSGNDRARFADAVTTAANKDEFVQGRNWESKSPWPCLLAPRGDASHTGSTALQGYDDWKAQDSAGLRLESWHIGLFSMGCKTDFTYPLGSGAKSASDWGYTGLPDFYDLSKEALAYDPANSDAAKRDPRLKFAIRLTRSASEQRTSSGRSAVRPSGSMEIYSGAQAGGVMAAVATSEVFFERPPTAPRGGTELASLFNPYWQVHLIGNSTADIATAVALQAGVAP
jgi:hypothetical protein